MPRLTISIRLTLDEIRALLLDVLPNVHKCSVCSAELPLSEFFPNETCCRSCYHSIYGEYNPTASASARDTIKKARHSANNRQRRGAMLSAGQSYAAELLVEMLIQDATECAYCSRPFGYEIEKTLEHIVPLSRGGSHTLNNLTVICRECNSSKGSKTLDEWQLPLEET